MTPRPKHGPVQIAAPLSNVLRAEGLVPALRQVQLCTQWIRIMGPAMGRATWPEVLKEGVLIIATEHPAWRHEIHYRQEELLARVRSALGEGSVMSIATVVRQRPDPVEPPPLEARPQADEFGQDVARPVEDPVLHHAIRRAAAAHAEARFRRRRA